MTVASEEKGKESIWFSKEVKTFSWQRPRTAM